MLEDPAGRGRADAEGFALKPLLVACWFQADAGWPDLARVFERTVREHLGGWETRIEQLNPDRRLGARGSASDAHNTQKLNWWVERVLEAEEGREVALLDVDTFLLRPLDRVWRLDFDVALTRRPATYETPYNAGVVFARANCASRAFFEEWRRVNAEMFADNSFHSPWRVRYGGMNQAALGYLLESSRLAARLLNLPCAEWNCEDATWKDFDPERTRVVHVKGPLRQVAHGHYPPLEPEIARLAALWQELAS